VSYPPDRDDALFAEALALPTAERSAYLDAACVGDEARRGRIDALLKAHEQAGDFMSAPASAPDEFSSPGVSIEHAPGERIGRYKLLEKIGEGGWGVVYVAEQEEPVRRRVALKVIKPGMDTAAVIARFEAERQALALMEHPNIARVFDGGATALGRPYFVMELVSGISITEYCDQQRLTTRQRLELFTHVCHAVQHAHQKGVIHRDLKPSNILVTLHDDKPVPKVIDFGIAKATRQHLTDKTFFTGFHHFVGTPAYMSPEQASSSDHNVDTRSDLYSLGVLLYELLTGRTPFDPKALLEAGFEEVQRAIREKEPLSPSRRVVSLSPVERTSSAQCRRLDSAGLISELRGDLDWIVMKCLQKDRARRYETVNGLAMDVGRYLRHEPVLARPDSVGYRAAKFVRRHRAPVAALALLLVVLVAGLVGTFTQARRAQRQAELADAQRRRADQQRDFALRQLSRAEAITEFNDFLLSDAAPMGKSFTVGDLLARAEAIVEHQQPETDENHIEILISVGQQHASYEQNSKSRRLLERAYALSRGSSDRSLRAKAAAALSRALTNSEEFARAESLIQEALAELDETPRFALDRVYCLTRGSFVARVNGKVQEAVERAQTAQRILRESGLGSALRDLSVSMDVAESLRQAGRHREAASEFERLFAKLTALGRGNTEKAGTLLNNWALAVEFCGRALEAERLFRRAIEIARTEKGEETVAPMLLNNYARVLLDLNRVSEAADYATRAFERARRSGSEVVVTQSLIVRSRAHRELGELDRCEQLIDELEQRWRSLPAGHVGFATLASQRANLLLARGDPAAALVESDRSLAVIKQLPAMAAYLPRYIVRRGEIALQASRLEAARSDAARALELERAAAGADAATPSSIIGSCHLLEGQALRSMGKREEARASFAAALRHLELTLGADHPKTRQAAAGAQ
jgi:serine/threonine protein kinase/tetratricopeptide (TPR) repeat protein